MFVAGPQTVEQIEGLVDRPVRPGALTIDLVDDEDGLQPRLESLVGHETGLGHRSLDRIDQQQHRIDHRQAALHFAAEISVARGIDNVDAASVPIDRGVLGQDRDAALAFELVRIHHAFLHLPELGEGTGLTQELVDERRFAMIDMGDDGDVTQLFDRIVHRRGSAGQVVQNRFTAATTSTALKMDTA